MEVYAYAVEERTEVTIWVLKEQQYIVAVVSFLRLKQRIKIIFKDFSNLFCLDNSTFAYCCN